MHFELYRDEHQEWRWKLHARNGLNIVTSGESYHKKDDAIRAIRLVQATTDETPIRISAT
ncbi:YegP family protein [Bradyrhizobium sp. 2S1]|uniref:YegP family protein n=1 Tax=Bradyrhizobium sp. 2S1 TaxID=1404429 RepID=UPI00140BC391